VQEADRVGEVADELEHLGDELGEIVESEISLNARNITVR